MIHHVHVYRTEAVRQIDVEAETEQQAMQTAIDIALKDGGWTPADCRVVAIIPRRA